MQHVTWSSSLARGSSHLTYPIVFWIFFIIYNNVSSTILILFYTFLTPNLLILIYIIIGEMREKLKLFTKKALIEGMSKSTSGSQLSLMSSTNSGPCLPAMVRDSPLLLQEIENLKVSLKKERDEKLQLQCVELKKKLDGLRPLPHFKKNIDNQLNELFKETTVLKHVSFILLMWIIYRMMSFLLEPFLPNSDAVFSLPHFTTTKKKIFSFFDYYLWISVEMKFFCIMYRIKIYILYGILYYFVYVFKTIKLMYFRISCTR